MEPIKLVIIGCTSLILGVMILLYGFVKEWFKELMQYLKDHEPKG